MIFRTYKIDEIKIRLKNDDESLDKINELFSDIVSGKIPLIRDSDGNPIKGISPVSMYSNYESDENGEYDLSILAMDKNKLSQLDELVSFANYKKYVAKGLNVSEACKKAWQLVFDDDIKRSFIKDFESAVPPEFTNDGKSHCYLYIGVEE